MKSSLFHKHQPTWGRIITTEVLQDEHKATYQAWLTNHVRNDFDDLSTETEESTTAGVISIQGTDGLFYTLIKFNSSQQLDYFQQHLAPVMRSKIPKEFTEANEKGNVIKVSIAVSSPTDPEQQVKFEQLHEQFWHTHLNGTELAKSGCFSVEGNSQLEI